MDPLNRRQALGERGTVSYPELAKRLGASAMTIRRDAELLCQEGSALKIPGGLGRVDPLRSLVESPITSCFDLQRA